VANEISLGLSLRVRNGNADESFSVGGLRFDKIVQGHAGGIVSIASAAVSTLSLGDVTTAGYAAFRNLSTATSGTAYIAVGAYDGTSLHEFVHLRRGQPSVLPLPGNVVVGAQSYGAEPLPLKFLVFSR
jgi:hypothetical protein